MGIHGIESHGLRYVALAQRTGSGRARGRAGPARARPINQGRPMDVGTARRRPAAAADCGTPTDRFCLATHTADCSAGSCARAAPESIAALILADPAIGVSRDLARASVTYEYSSVGHSWPDHAAVFAEFAAGRPESGAWSAALDAAVAVERKADGLLHPVVAPDAVAAGWRQMQEPLRSSSWHGPTLLIEAGREHGAFVSPAVVDSMREPVGVAARTRRPRR